MGERISRSEAKAISRGLALARKSDPGLTRAAFLDQRPISISNQGSLPDANLSQSKDWCGIAQKICRDTRNPWRVEDVCKRCPPFAKLEHLFNAEANLTD